MIFYIRENLGNKIKIDSLVNSSRGYHVFDAYNGLGLRHTSGFIKALYIYLLASILW